MATRFIDKEYGANTSTAITNDATGRNKVRDLPDAAGLVYDLVDNQLKFNAAGTIKVAADTSTAQTFTNKTLTSPVITGGSGAGMVVSKIVPFVEQAGSTLTGTVPLPAGSHLLEIQFVCTVLANGTSASLIIGDSFDADGWLTAADLKATDLLVGEVFSIINSGVTDTDSSSWVMATQGAYLTNVGRKGSVQATNSGTYYGTADKVEAVITQGTPGTLGRYFMIVYYSVPTVIAAVVA